MIALTNFFSCGMVQNSSTTFCCGNTRGFTTRKGCITAYRLINACLSKRLAYHSQSWLNNTLWSLVWHTLWHISSYYSFKIFSRFWLVKTTRIIHNNQLLFTKFGKKSSPYWINDVKSGAYRELLSQWRQNDVKSAARRRLLKRWPRKPGHKVVLYLVSGKTKSAMAKLL